MFRPFWFISRQPLRNITLVIVWRYQYGSRLIALTIFSILFSLYFNYLASIKILTTLTQPTSLSSVSLRLIYIYIYIYMYRVFRAQADWTLTLHWAVSRESPQPLAQKTAAARPEQLAHTVYCFC
jgi:hypothetical protein